VYQRRNDLAVSDCLPATQGQTTVYSFVPCFVREGLPCFWARWRWAGGSGCRGRRCGRYSACSAGAAFTNVQYHHTNTYMYCTFGFPQRIPADDPHAATAAAAAALRDIHCGLSYKVYAGPQWISLARVRCAECWGLRCAGRWRVEVVSGQVRKQP
jgi:hypothetical protein